MDETDYSWIDLDVKIYKFNNTYTDLTDYGIAHSFIVLLYFGYDKKEYYKSLSYINKFCK